MINVREFCEKYGVRHQTVYTKIRRKGKMLEGHIFKNGGHMVFDDFAENLLKPEIRKSELQDEINSLKNEILKKDSRIENLTFKVNSLDAENQKLRKSAAELSEQIVHFEEITRQEKIAKNDENANRTVTKKFKNIFKK